MSRTHRVALDWLFDWIDSHPKIQIRYIDTKHPIADILTKGNSHVMNGIIFLAKSKSTAMNLSSTVSASCSSAKDPIASKSPRILKASSGKPDARERRIQNPTQRLKKLIEDQKEIDNLTTIGCKHLTWRSTSFLCDKAFEITNAKTYVFADSVLCLGSMRDQPVEAWKNKIKLCLENCYQEDLNPIDGEPMEFEPRVQISEIFLQLNARSTSYCRCTYASDFERCRVVSSGANF